jgi:hypothetical protein
MYDHKCGVIVIYIISGIKAILQDSSVKIADDEGVSPSSAVTHEFRVICFTPRVMYGWWTKKTGTKMTTIQIEIWQICTV